MRAAGITAATVVAALGFASAARADQSFTVTNTNDSGSGSLRAAITSANGDTVAGVTDTITFGPAATGSIQLLSALPPITTRVKMQGPGARRLTIDGSKAGANLFTVQKTSAISGLTISHAPNRAVLVEGGDLTLSNDAFNENITTASGAVVAQSGGQLQIDHSTFNANKATGQYSSGGAISLFNAVLTARDSTFTKNTAAGGGAINVSFAASASAPATIVRSTIVQNGASTYSGGGISLDFDNLTLIDSVVTGNTTPARLPTEADIGLSDGASVSAQFSLIGVNPAGSTLDLESQALLGQDPKLGPLQDNGGQTDTRAPLADSPLVDAGKADALAADDQRGAKRPVQRPAASVPAGGDGSDVGAVELQVPAVTGVAPGVAAPASRVTIAGDGFLLASAVKFGTAAAPYTIVDDGHISAIVPAGTGTVDVRVSTPDGQTPVVAADRFTYPSPPAPPPAVDRTRPVLTNAVASPATFAIDRRGPAEKAVAARVKHGTTFRYKLSESARVVFTIELVGPGRKVGKRCVTQSRANRTKPSCVRYTRIGRFATVSRKGSNAKGFSGKMGLKRLKPGRYRAILVASDTAKNRSKPRYILFRVVSG